VQSFLSRRSDARQIPLPALASPKMDTGYPGQILPSECSDGFYYALLSKQA
jgi:hypothetical protein